MNYIIQGYRDNSWIEEVYRMFYALALRRYTSLMRIDPTDRALEPIKSLECYFRSSRRVNQPANPAGPTSLLILVIRDQGSHAKVLIYN